MDSRHPDDIEQALAQVREKGAGSDGAALQGAAPTHCRASVLAMPKTRHPLALLCFGVWRTVCRLWIVVRKHPWWSALALGGSIACAQFVCAYLGAMVLGGLMIWSTKKHT